jgi:hypothetical protein
VFGMGTGVTPPALPPEKIDEARERAGQLAGALWGLGVTGRESRGEGSRIEEDETGPGPSFSMAPTGDHGRCCILEN